MDRFGQSTPDSIRESHAVLRGVMEGRVTPHCRRAQRAHRVATRYPLSALSSPGARHAPPPRPLSTRADDGNDRYAMMNLVFGSAAPHAEQAITFFGTPPGKRVAALGSLAIGALLLHRMI